MRLETKEQRQTARQSWIQEQKTEIYKDIEILLLSKNTYFTLQIWKGTAGHPFINFFHKDENNLKKIIVREKANADKREDWKKQNADNRGRVLSDSAKTAKIIKTILKKEYPTVKFSVISSNFANGDSVDVNWIDGIPESKLDSFLNQFQKGHFDGMTDTYHYSNNADFPQAKYVHGNREISKEKWDLIRKQLADLMKINDYDNEIIPDDFKVNVRGRDNPVLRDMIYQLTRDYDFTKGFSGVRNEKTEDGQIITNSFEIY